MTIVRSLNVALGERSYPIYIGDGLLRQAELLQRHIPGKQVLLVSNESVAPLYLETVATGLAGYDIATLVLPDGEVFKTLDILKRIFDVLLERRFDRACTLLALGGGVVGDMTGFAAATYQRGVHYIQLPTTLLAQVDSSVGGKTAVNHPLGKNMIGAFHQPRCVIADIDTLKSLPSRELRAGLAEVIKYGLIADAPFFGWLEDNIEALLACEPAALAYAIERSCHNKAAIVAADERESGVRALLNLGHTFGHAIETGVGYGSWLHGEAVAAGICMAADLSARMGWLATATVERIVKLLVRTGLPVQPPVELDNDTWLRLMAVDKKVRDGQLRLIVLREIGQGTIAEKVEPEWLEATLNACRPIQA